MSDNLIGASAEANVKDFSDQIAWSDHSIAFYVEHVKGKDVLDVGCVMHNPENYRSKYWVHKAIKAVARTTVGIDLYEDGVRYLQNVGYDIVVADAQNFDLGRQFDVIVAGDIIEHLENLSGFLSCCRKHLRPDGMIAISTPNPWYWKYTVKTALTGEFDCNPEHTLWLCPRTMRQLLRRHNMEIVSLSYGSRYWRDRLVPLPTAWRHTTIHALVRCS